jgi:ferredoxin-type protein NapF
MRIDEPTRRGILTGRFFRARSPLEIGDGCFAKQNIVCQCCVDACATQAIRFRPQIGKVPAPDVIADNCTACGACGSACPASAIALIATRPEARQ